MTQPPKLLAAIVMALAIPAAAATVTLAWKASPAPGVTDYFLGASTNQDLTPFMEWPTGTNLSLTLTNTKPGHYWFWATCAGTNGVRSERSNVIEVEVPEAPGTLRIVVLQHSAVLTNFQDAGFFRILIKSDDAP